MSNLKDYFEKNSYKARYTIGDRVQGHWGKIPIRGTVGNDSCPDGVNPRISVHLDLPIVVDGVVKTILFMTHGQVKPLK
jgi:hypothetical protein